jgi:hypothetical protein
MTSGHRIPYGGPCNQRKRAGQGEERVGMIGGAGGTIGHRLSESMRRTRPVSSRAESRPKTRRKSCTNGLP